MNFNGVFQANPNNARVWLCVVRACDDDFAPGRTIYLEYNSHRIQLLTVCVLNKINITVKILFEKGYFFGKKRKEKRNNIADIPIT